MTLVLEIEVLVCVRGWVCVCKTQPGKFVSLIKLDLGLEDACIPYLKWKTYIILENITLGI